jgi:ribose transport system permease protein
MTFVLSGLAAGLAGMIVATRTSTAGVGMGANVEFDVIAAMLLGGISVQGGEGAIWRAVVGVLLLAMIDNGLTLLHVSPTYQAIVQGGIILAAIVLDARSRRSAGA